MHLYQWSCFFLLSSAILCGVGLISRHFKDNLLQNAGMVIGLYGFGSRFFDIIERGQVPFDWFLVHTAIGLFAYGMLWDTYLAVRKQKIADFVESHMMWGRRASDVKLARIHHDDE